MLRRLRQRFEPHEQFLFLTLAVGTVHLVDHILRFDHSGWPFRSEFSPFTLTFLVYPAYAVVLLARRQRLSLAILGIMAVAVIIGHLTETPNHQYTIWATNESSFPLRLGEQNLLDAEIPAIGIASVVVSLLTTAAFVISFLWFAWIAWRARSSSAAVERPA